MTTRPLFTSTPRPAERTANPWLLPLAAAQPDGMRPRLRLVAFPYAGGSATVYRGWPQRLVNAGVPVQVLGLQLPGRGLRLAEAPVADFGLLVSLLTEALRGVCSGLPTVFFGHSLGALLAFETACALQRQGAAAPVMLVVSGRAAPDGDTPTVLRDCRHDDDFVDELRRLQGTPDEVLDDPELLALLIPTIRADFALLKSWRKTPGRVWEGGPLLAMGGRDDAHVPLQAVRAWRAQAGAGFEFRSYGGGHFFLHEQERELVADLARRLDMLMVAA